jgi:hypothetical protein
MADTTISITQTVGGTANIISGGATGAYGRQVTIEFTPADGFELVDVLQDGEVLPPPKQLTGTGGGGADFCITDADCTTTSADEADTIETNIRKCVDGVCQDADVRVT